MLLIYLFAVILENYPELVQMLHNRNSESENPDTNYESQHHSQPYKSVLCTYTGTFSLVQRQPEEEKSKL